MANLRSLLQRQAGPARVQELSRLADLIRARVSLAASASQMDSAEGLASSIQAVRLAIQEAMEIVSREDESFSQLPFSQRPALTQMVLDRLWGFGPLEALLFSNVISELRVLGPTNIQVKIRGKFESAEAGFRDDQHLKEILRRLLVHDTAQIEIAGTTLAGVLLDGSRLEASLSGSGWEFSIDRSVKKFRGP